MGRLTLRLPDTLHERLELLAKQEGVSLNQYIVYALTQQSTLAYTITETPARVLAEQRAKYYARAEDADAASESEIDQFLATREAGEPDPEFSPELLYRVREKVARRKKQS